MRSGRTGSNFAPYQCPGSAAVAVSTSFRLFLWFALSPPGYRLHRAIRAWHTCLRLSRHTSQKPLAVAPHYSLRLFVSSDEKSDCAIAPSELRGKAYSLFMGMCKCPNRIFSIYPDGERGAPAGHRNPPGKPMPRGFRSRGAGGDSPRQIQLKISPFPEGEGGRGDGAKKFNRWQDKAANAGGRHPRRRRDKPPHRTANTNPQPPR